MATLNVESPLAAIFLSVLSIFTAPFLQTALLVLLITVTIVVIVALGVVAAYLLAALWAGQHTDEPNSAFDVAAIGAPLFLAFDSFFVVFASLLGGASSVVRSVAQTALDNLRTILLIVLLVPFALLWIQFYPAIITGAHEGWNGFFGPIFRPLLLPIADSVALLLGALLPLTNALSHFIKTLTTTALIRALLCAFTTVVTILRFATSALAAWAIALSVWITPTAGVGGFNATLTIGPNFTESGVQFGLALQSLRGALECTCASGDKLFYEPLTEPFGQPAFAQAFNYTTTLPAVFLTQGVLRPLTFSIANSNANPGAPFAEIFSRPSFNSTFDTARFAIINATTFADTYFQTFYTAWLSELESLVGFPLPTVVPPNQSLFTLTIAFPLDVFVLRPALLAFNILFNIDQVFGTLTGYQFLSVQFVLDGIVEYALVAFNVLEFFAVWLRQLAAILQTFLGPPAGPLVGEALDIAANVVETGACLVLALPLAATNTTSVVAQFITGTVYQTVASTQGGNRLNPLLEAQILWGDTPQNATCIIDDLGQTPGESGIAFAGTVRVCSDFYIFNATCRSVVALGIIPLLAPTGIANYVPNLALAPAVALCPLAVNSSVPCVAIDDLAPPPVQFTNQYNTTLLSYVDVAVCAASILDVLCNDPSCLIAGNFTRQFGVAVVDVVLVPINIVVHVEQIFTTVYLAVCVPFDAVLDAIQASVQVLSNTVRQVGNSVEATIVCPLLPPGQFAPEPADDLFCCTANLLDSAVAIFVELARQLVIAFRVLILAIAAVIGGGSGEQAVTLLNLIQFNTTFAAIDNATFSLVCIPLQVVPNNLLCDDTSNNARLVAINFTGTIGANVLTLIPQTVLGTTIAIIDTVASRDFFNGTNAVTEALVDPALSLLASIFQQFANIFFCVDLASPVGSALLQIADFLFAVGNTVIQAITDFILFSVLTFLGILQVLTGMGTELLQLAGAIFLKVLGDVLVALFGQGFICGVQDAVCFFSAGSSTDFAIEACLALTPPYAFVFCTSSERPATFPTCTNEDTACAFGGCPHSPFGCCSSVPFPAPGGSTANLTDLRISCGFVFGPTFTFDNSTLPALAHSFGQPTNTACPLFASNTVCVNVTFIDRNTGLPVPGRKRAIDATPPLTLDVCLGASFDAWPDATVRQACALAYRTGRLRMPDQDRAKFGTVLAGVMQAPFENAGTTLEAMRIQSSQLYQAQRARGPTHATRLPKRNLALGTTLERLDAYTMPTARPPAERHVTRGLFAHVHAHHAAQLDKRKRAEPAHGVLAQLGAAMLHAADAIEHLPHVAWPERSMARVKRSVAAATGHDPAAWREAEAFLARTREHISARLGAVFHATLARPFSASAASRKRAPPHLRERATPLVDVRLLPAQSAVSPFQVNINQSALVIFGIQPCDPTTQIVCTNCTYFDDAVFTIQTSIEGWEAFYGGQIPNSFPVLVQNFSASITRTLVNPLGTDTYLTDPPTVPFVLSNLDGILWPSLWNYTTFFALVGPVPPNCTYNVTAALAPAPILQQIVVAVFGVDTLDAFTALICAFSAHPADTLSNLFEFYLVCGYEDALYCNSPYGVGLVSGFFVAVVALGLVVLALGVIPGCDTCLTMAFLIGLLFLVPWIGYGSSPLCTFPTFYIPVPGVPACIGRDVYQLVEQTLPPALPYPIGLIDPAFLGQAGTQLVTANLPPPPLLSCAQAIGMSTPLDTFFFLTTRWWGESVTQQIGAALDAIIPGSAAIAAKYTDAYEAQLKADHNVGAQCALLTLPALVLELGLLLLALAAVTIAVIVFVPVIIYTIVFIFVTLYLIYTLLDRADEGFVEDRRVGPLKFKSE